MRKQLERYPYLFLGLTVTYYVIFFGVIRMFDRNNLWTDRNNLWTPNIASVQYGYAVPDIHPGVVLTVIIGVIAFAITYLMAARLARAPEHGGDERSVLPVQIYIIALLLLIALAVMINFDARPPVAYQIISNLKFFAIFVIRHNQITDGVNKPLFWLGNVVLLGMLGTEANLSLLTSFAMSVLCLLVIEFLHGRRRWMVFLIIGVVTVGVYPVKKTPIPPSVYNECADEDTYLGAMYFNEAWSKCRDLESRVNLVAATATWSVGPVIRRLSADALFDRVYRETPNTVPFWRGRTLRPLFYVLIPRFLMPDKPRENIGQEFGHAYKITNPGDFNTSINIPWIVDLYANFSTWGVIFGMAIIGALLGFLTSLGSIFRGRPTVGFLAMGLTFPLVYPESNISMMFGNAMHGAVGGILIMLLVWGLKRFRTSAP